MRRLWLLFAEFVTFTLAIVFVVTLARPDWNPWRRNVVEIRESAASGSLVRVPVTTGDFFVVPAGTPHAIGGGIVLVEPQRVLPGRRGVTYRYWDWNRRYDASGHASSATRASRCTSASRARTTRGPGPRRFRWCGRSLPAWDA